MSNKCILKSQALEESSFQRPIQTGNLKPDFFTGKGALNLFTQMFRDSFSIIVSHLICKATFWVQRNRQLKYEINIFKTN